MKSNPENIKKQKKSKQKPKQKNGTKKYKKTNIPKAVREQCWLLEFGKKYEHVCYISWCSNIINVFDFHVGHDQPESLGGTLDISNIKPICARCNLSMSNNYTIREWNIFNEDTRSKRDKRCFGCV